MRQYSEYEVETLIEDLTTTAHEAIEQAVVEAARTAALASVEREAVSIREAQTLREENSALRKSRGQTAIVTGVICFFGGLALGAGTTTLLIGR
jgi:hypothetical protein